MEAQAPITAQKPATSTVAANLVVAEQAPVTLSEETPCDFILADDDFNFDDLLPPELLLTSRDEPANEPLVVHDSSLQTPPQSPIIAAAPPPADQNIAFQGFSVINNETNNNEIIVQAQPEVQNFPSNSSFSGAVFNLSNCVVNFNSAK